MTANEFREILADALNGAADRLRAGIVASEAVGAQPVAPTMVEPLADVTEPVLGVEEVARLLGLGRGSVYEAVRAGQIPSVRVGHRVLVPTHALRTWLAHAKN